MPDAALEGHVPPRYTCSRPGSPSPPTSSAGSNSVNLAVVPSSRASAAAFSRSGSVTSAQRPVSSRYSRAWSAATCSAGWNSQCPAPWT